MGTFMSDEDRLAQYDTAIRFINEAKLFQKSIMRQRKLYNASGTDFGAYGSELDAILAQAAQMEGYAQAELAAIDNNAQPWVQVGVAPHLTATWNVSTDRLDIEDLTDTDYPASGTILVTGSILGNDGIWTVSSVSAPSLILASTPTAGADHNIRVEWLTYP